MAIVTFWGNSEKETGNTYSSIAIATYMSIEHNMKILLITTNFNENTLRASFWEEKTKSSLIGGNKGVSTIQNGIEGISRMVSSNKIEPRMIRDYTNVILSNRFDVLLGYNGDAEQYREIQKIYPQVISVANQFYDMVIIDLDKRLQKETKNEILKISDVTVITTDQKIRNIQRIEEGQLINNGNSLIAIGKYDDTLKSNARNISRNILRKRKIVNTIPYNGVFTEAVQEGKVIDKFLDLLRMQNKKDSNYIFIQEVGRLTRDIIDKIEEVRVKRSMR